jgi:phosphohistidine phosphatase
VTFEPRAYDASALTLLYLARELPSSCRAALLIGHNPAISELAASLGTSLRFPTAAVAVLEVGGDWADLAAGRTRLLDFTAPS